MSNPQNPELPVNALIGLGARPIELRSALSFLDPAHAAALLTLIGGQPLDADLTAIAALSTTTFGRALLTMADAGAAKTALALVKGDVGLGNVTNDAQLKAADLDTDGTLVADSDTKIASQKAVKSYVDAHAGGSSAPGLPTWTFDPALTGTPAAGHFQLNGVTPDVSNQIIFSVTPKGGLNYQNGWLSVANSVLINLTDAAGKTYSFFTTGAGSLGLGDVFTISGACNVSDAIALSGDYQISFVPINQLAPVMDTILAASSITPVADGTYTVGIGGTQNGTITVVKGLITAVQEAIA